MQQHSPAHRRFLHSRRPDRVPSLRVTAASPSVASFRSLAPPPPPHVLAGLASRLAAEHGGLTELLGVLRVALACRFAAAQDSCLEGLADHIAAAGACWPPGLAEALEALDSAVLTLLLRKAGLRALGSIYRPSPILDVRPEAAGGAAGGFTFCLLAFSTHHDTEPGGLYSPWAEVGGFRWRLNVYPEGKGDSKGSHLAGKFACLQASSSTSCSGRQPWLPPPGRLGEAARGCVPGGQAWSRTLALP